MNKRLLFLVAVLSLSLLSVSLAALGTTSTTADIEVTIAEYVSISVSDGIDITVENPDSTNAASDTGTFTVDTNASGKTISLSDDISWSGLTFSTTLSDSSVTAGGGDTHNFTATVSDIDLGDGVTTKTGEVTITVS